MKYKDLSVNISHRINYKKVDFYQSKSKKKKLNKTQ